MNGPFALLNVSILVNIIFFVSPLVIRADLLDLERPSFLFLRYRSLFLDDFVNESCGLLDISQHVNNFFFAFFDNGVVALIWL